MAKLSSFYLVLFNLASALGWAYLLFLTVKSLAGQKSPQEFYEVVGDPLRVVQSLAVMEIIHSALGLVRSPLFTNILQVGSRLLLTWAVTTVSPASQAHWSLYLMVGSWSLVEVPRYLFYSINLITTVPAPLFWMRYNFFTLLYPSGITGEVFQMLVYLPAIKTNLPLFYFFVAILLSYLPGSPTMFSHMVAQRSAAKTARLPKPIVSGIEFPISNTKTGERGTTEFGKNALIASIKGVDEEEVKNIERERNWRFKYNKHIVAHSRICAAADAKDCVKIAKQGLEYLHDHFVFIRDGKATKLSQAMKEYKGSFETGFIQGSKPKPSSFNYKIPYLGKDLEKQEIVAQLDKWVQQGVIEESAGRGIREAVQNQEWLDLSDKYFVLLGAGSAMGPLKVLLSLGANVIAVDIDRPGVWENLFKQVRDSCGTMTFPLKKPQKDFSDDKTMATQAGCNLFTQTPEIRNWVQSVHPSKSLIIGGYAYLDGALHVKVAVAMDVIMAGVCETRKDTALAFLCTPTDCHMIPEEAWKAANENYNNAPWWQKIFARFGLVKNVLRPVNSLAGLTIHLVDGVTVAQGPNYALAKRMQHWRAIVAKSEGFTVSTNIAPSTKTVSVVSNTQFAAAYNGMHHFKPMEIMFQETSNAVMGALLIHDVSNPKCDSSKLVKLAHPLVLFSSGGFHGGVWRCGWTISSLGFYAALIFYMTHYRSFLVLGLAALVGLGYTIFQAGLPHHWV